MRQPMLYVVVGQKEIGKSTTTMKILREYVNGNVKQGIRGRKVLIFDTQNENAKYGIPVLPLNKISLFSIHPKIEMRRIAPFKPNGDELTPDEKAMAVLHVLKNYTNGLLLLEDINEYIGDHLPHDVVGKILSQRHKGLDIILHYHSLGRIQKKIWPHVTIIRFHKCGDSVTDNKDKFPDKYEVFKIAENIINTQFYNGNIRFHLHIDYVKQKIIANITDSEKETAVDEYIMMRSNALVRPYLEMRDKAGQVVYTHEKAYNLVKERLLKAYF